MPETRTVQQWEDAVIEECNQWPSRSIDPGFCASCDQCQSDHGFDSEAEAQTAYESGYGDEGGFSYQDCECCGSSLGGDRYAAHAIDKDGGIVHYDICVDCLFYLENGDLPDASGFAKESDDE